MRREVSISVVCEIDKLPPMEVSLSTSEIYEPKRVKCPSVTFDSHQLIFPWFLQILYQLNNLLLLQRLLSRLLIESSIVESTILKLTPHSSIETTLVDFDSVKSDTPIDTAIQEQQL